MQQHGSRTSSSTGSSLTARLIVEALLTFVPTSLLALRNATSSPASLAGASRSASPAGLTTERSGQARVRANLSALSANEKASQTSDTCGPSSSASSRSADLQRCLESRLRARMGESGSPEYAMTWKVLRMPWGLPICVLRASPRRTSDSGFIGWVTPTTRDWKDTPGMSTMGGGGRVRIDQLPRQAARYLGTATMRSLTSTARPVASNPELHRWLIGFPATWGSCAPTAMQ